MSGGAGGKRGLTRPAPKRPYNASQRPDSWYSENTTAAAIVARFGFPNWGTPTVGGFGLYGFGLIVGGFAPIGACRAILASTQFEERR